jgi:hypothetical protein
MAAIVEATGPSKHSKTENDRRIRHDIESTLPIRIAGVWIPLADAGEDIHY